MATVAPAPVFLLLAIKMHYIILTSLFVDESRCYMMHHAVSSADHHSTSSAENTGPITIFSIVCWR